MNRLAAIGIPQEVAGVRFPDSDLAMRALGYARQLSSTVLFNHLLRSFIFGSLVAERQGARVDQELFFLGAVLHDLGLTGHFTGADRFEVLGADAADRFLAEQGVPEARREVVWDAVALHTSIGIAARKRPEVALVHIGAGIDVFGLSLDDLPRDAVEKTVAALPRTDFETIFPRILLSAVERHPAGALFTWLDHTARAHVHGYDHPEALTVIRAGWSGWDHAPRAGSGSYMSHGPCSHRAQPLDPGAGCVREDPFDGAR